MTKHTQTTRTDQEIADLIAAETVSPAFENAFTETTGGFRMGYADEPTDADMPLPHAAELATEMAVRTFFDLFRDTRLEGIADRIAWGIVHSFHKVADQLDAEADKAALKVKDLVRDADGSEILTAELEEAHCVAYTYAWTWECGGCALQVEIQGELQGQPGHGLARAHRSH